MLRGHPKGIAGSLEFTSFRQGVRYRDEKIRTQGRIKGVTTLHDGIIFHSRIKWLIVVQMIVGISPIASLLLPHSMWIWIIPSLYAFMGLSIAQLMLLSLWVVNGSNKWNVRLSGALGGTAYVTIWPALGQQMSRYNESSFIVTFLFNLAYYAPFVLLSLGAFIVMQRKGIKLVHTSDVIGQVAPLHLKYSTLHLLVIMSICSLVLGLVKVSQADEQTAGFNMLAVASVYVLMWVVFLINSICAAWAALYLNSPWSRITIAIGISATLGTAVARPLGIDSLPLWNVIALHRVMTCSLFTMVFTIVVIVSLLVVRSCGYRLVPKELLIKAE